MTLPKFLARQGADRIVYRGMKGWGRSFSSVRGTALPINEFHAWYINQQHHLYCCASVRILYILHIILYFVYYIYYMLYIIYHILISNTTCTAVHCAYITYIIHYFIFCVLYILYVIYHILYFNQQHHLYCSASLPRARILIR